MPRHVLAHCDGRPHVLPGNAVLPAHHGVILTRGLQEWSCLLPQELPFASVARLLGWQTQDADVLSATTVRSWCFGWEQVINRQMLSLLAALA